ncbi:hypothetical protein D9M68_650220 [compost metagenome]
MGKYIKYTRIILLTVLSCLLLHCSGLKTGKATIRQGVFGQISRAEGNFMPSPDRPTGKTVPVSRLVYIYPCLKLSDTEGMAPLFTKVNKALIEKVKSNEKGYFQIHLAPGWYSAFIVEEGPVFFANHFDGNGYVNSFEVTRHEVTRLDIQVNYEASY